MKKHLFLTLAVFIPTLAFLAFPADFTVKAEATYLGANELPAIADDAIFQTPTLYASQTVTADCKNALAGILAETPPTLLPDDLAIELRNAPLTEFYGLSAAHAIKLNCDLPMRRLREVFYHELGHVIYDELAEEQKTVFEKRVAAYALGGAPNYVTQYALTNADEDFADSFMMYMTRRDVFLEKAEKSVVLREKYDSIDSYPKL